MKKPFKLTRTELIQLGLFIMTLLCLIALAAWASYEIRDLRRTISETKVASVTVDVDRAVSDYFLEHPVQHGQDGVTTTIVRTEPARNGKDATQEQVDRAVARYLKDHPVKGDKGEKGDTVVGPPGLTVLLRINPETNAPECKVIGDFRWQPLEECNAGH